MKLRVHVLFLLLACLGTLGAQQPDSLRLHVMTFNIRYGTANDGENRWELRRELVFDLLKRELPDIIGLQEALRYQIDEIRNALPLYDETGLGREDGKTGGEFSAILFRRDRFQLLAQETFWLSDSPAVPGSKTWGNSITRICSWGRFVEKSSGATFLIYNLHLDHISQPSREKSAELVRRRIDRRSHPDPFVVMGDFNAGEQNAAITILKGESPHSVFTLVDSFRKLHPGAGSVGTFHAFKGMKDGDKIDHIFVTPETVVLQACILHDNLNGRYPSDHFPVDAKILLPTWRKK